MLIPLGRRLSNFMHEYLKVLSHFMCTLLVYIYIDLQELVIYDYHPLVIVSHIVFSV